MYTDFAKRFKQACAEAGAPTTQAQLGRYLGISGPMVCYLRNGDRLPSAATGKKIAEKLRVSYDWLMLGSNTHKKRDSIINNNNDSPPALDIEITQFTLEALEKLYPRHLQDIQGYRWTAERFNKLYRLKCLKPDLTIRDLEGAKIYMEI